jgi:hypothetical protein
MTTLPQQFDQGAAMRPLTSWADFAESSWQDHPSRPGQGWYGTGYNNWGVQTNQKYCGAMAVLSALGPEPRRPRALDRALAALRFSLDSHVSGSGACSDGTRWGHTWISALGIERMMHGVALLETHLDSGLSTGLRRVLTSEAEWLATSHRRGDQHGVVGDVWAASGRNAPESNLWNGALMWRAAVRYPDDPRAPTWREQALLMMINGVSVAADADDRRIVDGLPIRQRFRGANFFPHFALDHHGYLNVGYMVICVSNAAMLHFDLKAAGLEAPQALHHHQAELWSVLRRFIFADGRLARIGGDSRVRYAYCQDYLLPALLYAADELGDPNAIELTRRQLDLVAQESAFNGDGSFYGRRLDTLRQKNPYYYTRLESDRACALSMTAAYLPMLGSSPSPIGADLPVIAGAASETGFEDTVSGGWCEPEHGAVLHRSRRRLASFSWRAHGLAQGMCQPPNDGRLAEWQQNLGGRIHLLGDVLADHTAMTSRRLLGNTVETFDGGFVTSGAVVEGAELRVAEGWSGADGAISHLAIAALPDDRTMVGLHLCRAGAFQVFPRQVHALRLNIPNDLYNDFQRTLATAAGPVSLRSPAPTAQAMPLDSRWVNVDNAVGAVAVYGTDSLWLDRSDLRRGGVPESIFVETICHGCPTEHTAVPAGGTIVDIGWVVLSAASTAETKQVADAATAAIQDNLRAVSVTGADGSRYLFAANFSDQPAHVPEAWVRPAGVDAVTGQAPESPLAPGGCRLLRW